RPALLPSRLSLHNALPISGCIPGTCRLRRSSQCPRIAMKTSLQFFLRPPGTARTFLRWAQYFFLLAGFVALAWYGYIQASATKRAEEHTSELQSRFVIVCR